VSFEREAPLPGMSQRIDFILDHPDCGKILLEVKDILNTPPPSGFFDPYRPIRAHIEAGTRKFKNAADYVCVLVLAAPPNSFVQLNDPVTIMGSMYGNLGFRVPVNLGRGAASPDMAVAAYIVGEGKMIRKTRLQNRRIAAIVSVIDFKLRHHAMRKYVNTDDGRSREERVLDVQDGLVELPDFEAALPGVTVWENAIANRKLPRDLFKGEMDAWWEVSSDGRQLPTYIGDLRRALDVDTSTLTRLGLSL
jgi:hypothetical protein